MWVWANRDTAKWMEWGVRETNEFIDITYTLEMMEKSRMKMKFGESDREFIGYVMCIQYTLHIKDEKNQQFARQNSLFLCLFLFYYRNKVEN